MKKIIVTCLAILSFGSAFSQFSQGNFLVGGMTNLGLNFTTSKVKSGGATNTVGKTTSFSLQPQGGYFVIDNLAAGLGISLATETFKQDGTSNKQTTSQTAITPFVRYYLDKFYFQGTFGFGSQKVKTVSGGTTVENKDGLSGWSVLAGYPIFLNDSVSLEPQLGYGANTVKDKNTDVKSINSGIIIGIGLYAYISK